MGYLLLQIELDTVILELCGPNITAWLKRTGEQEFSGTIDEFAEKYPSLIEHLIDMGAVREV
jgi:hypothetical protein